ncbi:hypothetical protein [Sulfurimonas sp. HSL3-2]|uniref:hypothetical protein n=1 Tax=Hydrocurvibacter mobilis TaxID=3131936 RepID=UPI0031F77BA1
MEHYVIIEKLCSCAKREGLDQITIFDDKSKAKGAADKQLAHMQGSFCGKHEFDVTEVDDHFVIGMLGGCDCSSSAKH